jgi:hypothetical protein
MTFGDYSRQNNLDLSSRRQKFENNLSIIAVISRRSGFIENKYLTN